jgi:hypothetical protein
MKTLLYICLFAIVAMLAMPAVAQNPFGPPPGFYIYWNIAMHSPVANGGSGTAQYFIEKSTVRRNPTPGGAKVHTTFSVDCEYLQFPGLTPLQVFVGNSQTTKEPFGKLVGEMSVQGGTATFLTAHPPLIEKGMKVTIVHQGTVIMKGTF